MTKILSPLELSSIAKTKFDKPERLSSIFCRSLSEDAQSASKKLQIEASRSKSVGTMRKVKETKAYIEMLDKVLPQKEKQSSGFQKSLFDLDNLERKSTQSNKRTNSSFFSQSDSSIMSNPSFFVNDDFSQCFDDNTTQYDASSSYSSSSVSSSRSRRTTRKNSNHLLDDDEQELSGMFDRLSTSESEG